jgi:MFS family permease
MASQTVTSPAPAKPVVHPLRNPNFRLLWAGSTVSVLGDQFYLVALPWLILQLTSSSVALGTIMMMASVPRAVLMLLGGAVSDRFSPRRVMMMTASTRTVFVGAIGLLLWVHQLHLWHLYLLGFAFGVADAFGGPSSQAFMPSLVEPEQLPAANSVSQVTIQVSTIVGPAPAGLVVKSLGVAWAFIIDAISFLFIIGALWKLPDPPVPEVRAARPGMWKSIVAGLKYMNGDLALRALLIVSAALNFCITGPFAIGLPWIARNRFATPVAYSIFVSSAAVGGLLGALAAGVVRPRRRGPLLVLVSGIIAVCMVGVGLLGHLWSLAAVLFVVGLSAGFLNVHLFAWFQQRVEREMLGRAMSVLMFAAFGLQPLSLLIAGLVIKMGVTALFTLAGGLLTLVTLRTAFVASVRNIE